MTIDLDVYVTGIVERDAGAFAKWVAGAEFPIRRSLRSFADVVDVESVFQETLIRVWQTAPRFRPDGGINSLLRNAFSIGRNLALQEVRRLRATPTDVESLEDVLAREAREVSVPDPILRRAIGECRDKLPPQPRKAFDARLTSAGGRADDELATAVGMQLNTFLQNFTRARQQLADCLKQRGIAVKPEVRS
jgi:RNA polymerase sigma-70 factor (ECF subfamily)